MQAVQPPVVPLVARLIRQNPDTISLGQGTVYYGPPQAATARVEHALAGQDIHQYGPVGGLAELRDALARKLSTENGIDADPDSRLLVTAGANMAFVNTVLAIADPGDEFILPLPYYFNHEMALRMLNCEPVAIASGNGFLPDPDVIAKAITARTRALVTISPNNPSGAVYPRELLAELNVLCKARGIYHIHDEAYEYFTFDGAEHFSPGSLPDASSHTVSLFSLSKSYGFAGWRIGYMVIPEHLMEAVYKVQDTNLICPNQLAQHAALGCLEAGSGYVRHKKREIEYCRQLAVSGLQELNDRCQVITTDGAFYFLFKFVSELTEMQIVERLIVEHGVAVIPGSTFGLPPGHLRVAYGALRRDSVNTGMNRLVAGLKALL
jgi:aspartate/methionine/tyrosine aminotransferase